MALRDRFAATVKNDAETQITAFIAGLDDKLREMEEQPLTSREDYTALRLSVHPMVAPDFYQELDAYKKLQDYCSDKGVNLNVRANASTITLLVCPRQMYRQHSQSEIDAAQKPTWNTMLSSLKKAGL